MQLFSCLILSLFSSIALAALDIIDMRSLGNTIYLLAVDGNGIKEIVSLPSDAIGTSEYIPLTTNLDQVESYLSLTISPISQTICVLGTSGFLYCSTNSGVTFEKSAQPFPGTNIINFDKEGYISFAVKDQTLGIEVPWFELTLNDALTMHPTVEPTSQPSYYHFSFNAAVYNNLNIHVGNYEFDGTGLLDRCFTTYTFSADGDEADKDLDDVFAFNFHTNANSNPVYNGLSSTDGSYPIVVNNAYPCHERQESIGAFSPDNDVGRAIFGTYNPNGWVFKNGATPKLIQTFKPYGNGFTYQRGVPDPIKKAVVEVTCGIPLAPNYESTATPKPTYLLWKYDSTDSSKIIISLVVDRSSDLCVTQFPAAIATHA